jgi:hypothetical protein
MSHLPCMRWERIMMSRWRCFMKRVMLILVGIGVLILAAVGSCDAWEGTVTRAGNTTFINGSDGSQTSCVQAGNTTFCN